MMTIFSALWLGIVEGLTEFLPVSSTGHLILFAQLLKLPDTNFLKSFEIIIQLGAILSVVVLYWRKLLVNWEVMKRIAVAFVPTGLIGLALYKVVKTYFLGSDTIVLWSLLLGGLVIIAFELWHHERTTDLSEIEKMSYTKAATIGLFQAAAIVPGVSRSAATIIGGLALRIKRETIVEFSFLLAVPTMVAATGLDLVKNAASFSSDQVGLLAVGFLASFVVALITIKAFLHFIKSHNFISFGFYRVLLALVFFLIVL